MKNWLFAILGLMIFSVCAQAVEIKLDDDIYLERTYTENVIAMGDQIEVKSKIGGSAWLFGGSVDFQGEVQEELYCFSGDITLDGYVWQDVYLFGGEITVDGTMRGDVHIFGGDVRIAPDAVIKGDLTVRSEDLTIDGRIDGDVNIKSESVTVNGIINNDAKIEAKDIDISSEAIIVGDLIRPQWSNKNNDWSGIRGDVYDFHPVSHRRITLGFFLSSLFVGLIWYKLFPRSLSCTGQELARKPVAVSLWGLFYILVLPVVFILLLVGVLTIPLAILLMIVYGFTFYLGQFPIAVWIGGYIGRHSSAFNKKYLPLVTGLVLMYLLMLIPGIKGLLILVWGIAGFGSIWYYMINMRRQRKAALPSASQPVNSEQSA